MRRPGERPEPVSRRDRPAKPPLSRQAIVAAALGLVGADAEKPLTLRRLAQELDTGAASLYVYFENTADLNAAVLDDLLGTIDLERGTDPWRTRAVSLLISYTGVLYAHPALASTALIARPTGKNTLRVWESLLALLDEGGVDRGQAAWGVDMLIQRATATAVEAGTGSQAGESPADDPQMVDSFVGTLPADEFPHLASAARELFSGTHTARLTWGFEVLIAGIERTPMPSTSG